MAKADAMEADADEPSRDGLQGIPQGRAVNPPRREDQLELSTWPDRLMFQEDSSSFPSMRLKTTISVQGDRTMLDLGCGSS